MIAVLVDSTVLCLDDDAPPEEHVKQQPEPKPEPNANTNNNRRMVLLNKLQKLNHIIDRRAKLQNDTV